MRVISTPWDRWIGFTNDPAETETWCAWMRVGHWVLYAWPYKIKLNREWL